MSYRNDHDAALHRVDALEGELLRLRTAYDEKQREPVHSKEAPEKRRRASSFVGGVALLSAALVVVALQRKAAVETPDEPAWLVAVATAQPDWLRSCIAAIERPVFHLDASNTDPRRVEHEVVARIAGTGAGCRDVLADWVRSGNHPRIEQLGAWSAAEDQLVGAITRILVYYGSDPYALDNYATAPQLWREYGASLATRDQALRNLVPL